MTTNNNIKAMCVFCGSKSPSNPIFSEEMKNLVSTLLSHNMTLVYGGGSVGMMGQLAHGMLEGGAKVKGVIPKPLAPKEVSGVMLGDFIYVPDMHSRKLKMYKDSDAFIAFPGGFGTYDELLEIITWAQLGIHAKPIGLLNVEGFFDPLIAQIQMAVKHGFIDEEFSKNVIVVATTAKELVDKMIHHSPPSSQIRWISEDQL
eukprot:TRINITY_DN1839_c0_g1_i1.p1 TRINITY_DN1839_c0_g1~~TRINITY_DN1839_c0_g1_i1.p1  ORF type:complete len:202 (-),score=50.31 TRINITY_DN1839_c0_g1_i1:25-630(-)